MMWYGGGWLMMLGMGVFWLVFLAVVIVGGIYLVRYLTISTTPRPQEDSALAILRKRYASGEITKEEFEEARKHLLS